MKNDDRLTASLRQWGQAQATRYDLMVNKPRRTHALDRALDFAPGTRAIALKRLATRDGRSRREIMAAAACVPGLRFTPQWSSDPIPCSETHKRAPRESIADATARAGAMVDNGTPDELRWIDRALGKLALENRMWAMVVRAEFTTPGPQTKKAARVQYEYGGELSLRQYRRALRRALDWLGGVR